MITFLVRRVFPLAVLGAALILLIRIQRVPEMGSDAYLHLRLGNEFRSGWSLSQPGHLSTFDTGQWYPSQWLSQVAMSWTETTFGLMGIIWLAGAFTVMLPLFMYLACRRSTAPLPSAVAAVIGTCAAAPGLSARPQVISYLLVLLVTVAWLETAEDHRPRYWLILVAWIWVPLHGMWVVGLTVSVAAVIGIALSRSCPKAILIRLASIPLLSALVALLTPLGIHAYSTVIGVSDRNSQLTEWDPPDFTSPNSIVLAVMIAVILMVALRRDSLDWPMIMILGLGMAWGLHSVRSTIVAGVILTPLLANAIQHLVPTVAPAKRREVAAVVVMGVAAFAALGFVASQRSTESPVPNWVEDRLAAMPPETKVLNDWELGHYALWRHPDLQLVMHGYVDVFTVEELQRNLDIARLAPEWDKKVADLDVDYAFVQTDSQLAYGLTHLLDWKVVVGDDEFQLLLPPAD